MLFTQGESSVIKVTDSNTRLTAWQSVAAAPYLPTIIPLFAISIGHMDGARTMWSQCATHSNSPEIASGAKLW